jgi:DNA polymerase (family 10)
MERVGNTEIARMFNEIADLLEIEDASPFRVRAYRTAASTLSGLGEDVRDMLGRGEPLSHLPGIGKDLAGKIDEALRTGSMQALDELHAQVPLGLELLLRIPGLGPKRVKALNAHLGIEDLEGLRLAAEAGQVRTLPGFGAKTEQRILQALAAHREKKPHLARAAAMPHAQALLAHLRGATAVMAAEVAGSYRRGKDTIGDLDLLVTATDAAAALNRFASYPHFTELSAHGPTRAAALLDNGLQVDLRVVAPSTFGAALHYFTGSKGHNIQVRRLGQQRGLKINEYGVFRANERIGGDTEDSVFAAVGLPFIPPELREDQGEIAAASEGRLPRLVARADLRGDLHSHTVASDGHAELRAMALAARARGLEYLAITDHSQRLALVHGLDEARLRTQLEAIDRLNSELDGITLLKGIEVDILEDGNLDLPDTVLRELDLVLASVHTAVRLPRKKQTERVLRAMDHRYFSILGHPGGRLRPEREGYAIDLDRVLRHARERGCFMELDSQPKRLDLDAVFCRRARDLGVLVSISSDSHRPDDLDHLALGVIQARRGWLEGDNVLNTRPLADVRRHLRSTFLA